MKSVLLSVGAAEINNNNFSAESQKLETFGGFIYEVFKKRKKGMAGM